MGSWAELRVGKVSLLSTKYDVDPIAMTVFRESDKVIRRTGGRLRDEEVVCEYRTTVGIAKARLDLMGFSLGNTEADFRDCKVSTEKELVERIRSEHSERERESTSHELRGEFQDFSTKYEAELALQLRMLKDATFQKYLRGFAELYAYDAKHGFLRPQGTPGLSRFGKFMLSSRGEFDDFEYWFPCSDRRFMLRAYLEKLPDGLEVVQDVTDLIAGGYYEADDPICSAAQESLIKDYPINTKIIVLTEGSTDAAVVRASLDLLYPKLAGYYSFMDFGLSRAMGGAGALVQILKAFVGSGITNRVVALFDNDTAARDALANLSGISLPRNIRAQTYPAIPLAATYPTLGPGGLVRLDINGLACSIELFLGRDVLTTDGRLRPVQWAGYNNKLRQYQGEIVSKDEIHKRYWAKVGACQSRKRRVKDSDWGEMRILLRSLFSAFK